MKGFIVKLFIVLVVIAGLGYGVLYLWQNSDKYFFKGEDISTKNDIYSKQQKPDNNLGLQTTEENDKDEENGDNLDEDRDDNYFVPIIHKSDCENECAGRKSVEVEYEYCREICGLNDIRDLQKTDGGNEDNDSEVKAEDGEEGCDDIDDIFKEDVCWKTKAIKEKNDKYCDEIYSEELSQVCHNRVLEEIIN